jgi:hypothetical protein
MQAMWNFLYTLSVASAQELTVKEMKATNDFTVLGPCRHDNL